jgi:hypothetical protein
MRLRILKTSWPHKRLGFVMGLFLAVIYFQQHGRAGSGGMKTSECLSLRENADPASV